MKLMKLY